MTDTERLKEILCPALKSARHYEAASPRLKELIDRQGGIARNPAYWRDRDRVLIRKYTILNERIEKHKLKEGIE